jgi:hypothetical protein
MHANCLFTLRHAASAPLIRITSARAEALGANLYKVSAIVKNVGYLPSHMTQMALKHGTAGTVSVRLTLPDEAELLMNPPAQDLGHLAGRDGRAAPWSPWLREWETTFREAEWLVRGQPGTKIVVTASAQRAGMNRWEITLP